MITRVTISSTIVNCRVVSSIITTRLVITRVVVTLVMIARVITSAKIITEQNSVQTTKSVIFARACIINRRMLSFFE